MLAVTYPLRDGLSDMAQRMANLPPHDLNCGIENTLGYMFFEERASSVPIFELLGSYPVWTKSGLIDKPALMNAIWQDFPEYNVIANGLEQSAFIVSAFHTGMSKDRSKRAAAKLSCSSP